jgi:hypothetical protein
MKTDAITGVDQPRRVGLDDRWAGEEACLVVEGEDLAGVAGKPRG